MGYKYLVQREKWRGQTKLNRIIIPYEVQYAWLFRVKCDNSSVLVNK